MLCKATLLTNLDWLCKRQTLKILLPKNNKEHIGGCITFTCI